MCIVNTWTGYKNCYEVILLSKAFQQTAMCVRVYLCMFLGKMYFAIADSRGIPGQLAPRLFVEIGFTLSLGDPSICLGLASVRVVCKSTNLSPALQAIFVGHYV